ncbi:MAG TPA: hypothetical protein VGQ84_01570 [Gaiellaceae bacterium]|jgi:hypothetical protein|nr:hypothetical protein [Gaiellaceae bacterium]
MTLRRSLLGYRRSDVIDALEGMGAQLDTIARNLDQTWREKETLRGELETTRERHAEELRRQRLRGDRLEAEGRAAAARIVAEAEEQATRIRADAGRGVSEATSRVEHLLRVREQVLGELRGIVQAYGSLLAQVEHGRPLERVVAEEELQDALAPQRPALEHVAGSGDLYPTHVELDAGPFADFAELSAFERSLARLPKVEDVYVRRFGDERAEIELTLTEERPLVHDLTHHLPYIVRVTAGDGRLQIELGVQAAAAQG